MSAVAERLSDKALEFLADKPEARSLLRAFIVPPDGDKILYSTYIGGTSEKKFEDMVPVVGVVSVPGRMDLEKQAIAQGEDARSLKELIAQMRELGIMDTNSAGWCSSPLKHALAGEWVEIELRDGQNAILFEPDVKGRASLSELIEEFR